MSDEYANDYVSKAPKSLRWLDYKRKLVQDWFVALHAEGRWYAVGVAILAVAGISMLCKWSGSGTLVWVGALVFAFGLVAPVERLYEWLWQRSLGKLVAIGLVALITNIAYGVGRQLVAILIGSNPEPVSATVNVATILLSPLLFFGILATFGLVIFVIASYCGTLALMSVFPPSRFTKSKRAWLWGCRLSALGIAVFGSLSALKGSSAYVEWTSRRCAEYLYTFDLYHDAQLTTNKVEKVVALPDGRLLVGLQKKGGDYTFVTRSSDEVKQPTGVGSSLKRGEK